MSKEVPSWSERREVTEGLQAVRIDSVWNDEFNEDEPHAESKATIDRATEMIDALGYEVDRLNGVVNAYRVILKEQMR